ncbi:MAG: MFS transporter [Clostridia bacterium]|nr:MFS transporter [Clostridia bacterium]MBR5265775.1 MFS transporter [Clostridia bacterium]
MSLKNKYNLLYFLFCLVGCCIGGFVAVFLQYKGVSNTQIGLVTGIGCASSILLGPWFSNLLTKLEWLSPNKLLFAIYGFIAIAFPLIAYLNLSPIVIMVIYIVMYSLYICSNSFVVIIASGYTLKGVDINFGLARGLGSTSWAFTSLFGGSIIEIFDARILAVGFVIFTLMMFALMFTMPEVRMRAAKGEKGGSVGHIIKTYRSYFLVLLGFAICIMASTMLGTYLPNIVRSLGGTTATFGIAAFASAFSELPVMAMAAKWMKKCNPMTLFTIGGIAYICRTFIVCFAPNVTVLVIGMLFQSISYGLITAVVTYYVMYNLAPQDQVMGQSMIGMMTSGIGSTLGNVIGGVLQDTYGLGAMYTASCVLIVVGALVIASARFAEKKKA